MRAHVSFRVYGSDLADLREKAVNQLCALTGLGASMFDPQMQDAVPWTIEVAADATAIAGMVVLWRGDVRAEL